MKRSNLLAAAGGAIAAAMIAGGVAWATIPAADGVIQGCYQKNEGHLRVLDVDTETCHPSELPISWNAEGPQGEQGPQGERGPQGEVGPQGSKGDTGDAGAPGERGPAGADGASVTSAFEPAGANCADGGSKFTAVNAVTYACNGARGAQGLQGPAGPQGPPGPDSEVMWWRESFASESLGSLENFDVTATCPADWLAISGGFGGDAGITQSARSGTNGWRVVGKAGLTGGQITASVTCIRFLPRGIAP